MAVVSVLGLLALVSVSAITLELESTATFDDFEGATVTLTALQLVSFYEITVRDSSNRVYQEFSFRGACTDTSCDESGANDVIAANPEADIQCVCRDFKDWEIRPDAPSVAGLVDSRNQVQDLGVNATQPFFVQIEFEPFQSDVESCRWHWAGNDGFHDGVSPLPSPMIVTVNIVRTCDVTVHVMSNHEEGEALSSSPEFSIEGLRMSVLPLSENRVTALKFEPKPESDESGLLDVLMVPGFADLAELRLLRVKDQTQLLADADKGIRLLIRSENKNCSSLGAEVASVRQHFSNYSVTCITLPVYYPIPGMQVGMIEAITASDGTATVEMLADHAENFLVVMDTESLELPLPAATKECVVAPLKLSWFVEQAEASAHIILKPRSVSECAALGDDDAPALTTEASEAPAPTASEPSTPPTSVTTRPQIPAQLPPPTATATTPQTPTMAASTPTMAASTPTMAASTPTMAASAPTMAAPTTLPPQGDTTAIMNATTSKLEELANTVRYTDSNGASTARNHATLLGLVFLASLLV